MILRWLSLTFICCALSFKSYAQSPAIPELGISFDIVDRLDIMYGTDIFTSNRNYRRKEVFSFARNLLLDGRTYRGLEEWDIQYLIDDNNEWIDDNGTYIDSVQNEYIDDTRTFYKITENTVSTSRSIKTVRTPILKYFYKTPANFYEVDKPGFKMRVNPVINFSMGREKDNDNILFQNTRGINIRAYIDDKVYVFTNILENQARFYDFHHARVDRFRALPGNGLYKPYNPGFSDRISGYDFLNAQAFVGFNVSKSINIELGHGRHHLGNGIRSLLLSNYANNYFYLKFNTQIWKFHYQNIFAELAPISDAFNPGNTLLPKKYMANHFLAFKVSDNIEIGLFEAVIFSRQNQFELQYLNPVIFYRTVEHFLDSPDNVLIGLNGKWNVANKFQFYGQLILDEFKLDELTSGNGWWANKHGYQIGLKYINVINIDHLDAQIEYNTVTPYTYSHRDTLSINSNFALASYSHYNQPLAHPLGSNFREITGRLSYRPTAKMFITTRFVLASHGDNSPDQNWGGNILEPHITRVRDYGNEILQGERTDITLLGVDISYSFHHNYFLDLNFLYRKSESTLAINNFNTTYLGGGLRINLGQRNIDY
jgi:hypothetical protein